MSFAKVFTRSVIGLHAPPVIVEVHLSQGMPALTIVGLPEAAVRESKDRVRSALINTGFDFPNRRLTINLAPADLPKDGARLDLPIAMGLLAASGQIDEKVLSDFEFVGELSLDGELRPISGVLSIARALKSNNDTHPGDKARTLIVPAFNAAEAAKVAGVTVLAAASLDAVCKHLDVLSGINPNRDDLLPQVVSQTEQAVTYPLDLSDVKGQHHARRALEIAAAGGHSMLLTGPPGSGKTLLASRLPSILPPLTEDEALEVASIYSIAGVDYRFGERPHRAAHHTISSAALVGGGCQFPKLMSITRNKCHTLHNLGVLA